MITERVFAEQLVKLYMKTDFTLSPFAFQQMSSYKNLEVKSKKFVTDFDGVFEKEGTDPLYKLFFYCLEEENNAIEAERLIRFSKMNALGSPPNEIFNEMKVYLQARNLRKKQYDNACTNAAKRWMTVDDAWETVNEIKKLGYSVAIISGSVQEALEKVAQKIGIEEDVFGTRFEFDEFGRLKEIHGMLGQAKLEQKNKIVGKDEHISVTDDMNTDYFITFGAELAIVVADKDEKILQDERQLYVFDKKIRRNFPLLKHHLQKFEYSAYRALRTTKTIERRIIEYILALKVAFQEEKKKDILHYLLRLRYELEEFDPFLISGGEKTYIEYKLAEDTEREKRLRSDILSILQQIPEFVSTETFQQVIEYESK